MPTFKVQGQVYHRIGSMQPMVNEEPQFLQLYFVGNYKEQATRRNSISPGTEMDIILELQEMLHTRNNYVREFKYALKTADTPNFYVIINADQTRW